MTTVLNGLLGGFAAALVATLALRLLDAESIPAAVVGGDGGAAGGVLRSAAVTLLYGTVAGGALVALELALFDVLSVPPAGSVALGLALGWSAVLAAVLTLLSRVRGMATAQSYRTLLLFHLAYGLALGLWIRTTWLT